MFFHERLHGACLFGRNVLIGVRDSPEHVCKRGEVTRTTWFQVIERIKGGSKRGKLVLLGCTRAKPRTYRLQRHDICLIIVIMNYELTDLLQQFSAFMKFVNP